MPGPLIRVTEGQVLTVDFANRTGGEHNVHFHGRHSPHADGWEPVAPGGSIRYEFVAGPAGLHPYHCHTMPIDEHIRRGLHGLLIVDPVTPRTPAHEVVLIASGWDTDGDGRSDIFTWNGIAGFFAKYPIKVRAGELVRVYLANMIVDEAIVSFHLHAEMFDVYPVGAPADAPAATTDIVSLGPMDRAILEFRLHERGRYMFHPHQGRLAERGMMGWFAAI